MDFDEFHFLMMAESVHKSEESPHRLSVIDSYHSDSQPWSDVSELEWTLAADVDLGMGSGADIIDQRLSRSLDLGHGSLPEDATFNDSSMDRWGDAGVRDRERTGVYMPQCDYDEYPELQIEQVQAEPEEDLGENIKTRIMSVWNNFRYGLNTKLKTNFRYDSPIWLLGKCYRCSRAEKEEQKKRFMNGSSYSTNFDMFKSDFASRLWFTYRKEFPVIEGSQFKTDVGWGCMLRSGQMLLAQALMVHFMGRDWKWFIHQRRHDIIYHHQIIQFFGDQPSLQSPFSIHRLARIGIEHGKQPGDWYGPASMAYVLRDAMEQAPNVNPILGQLCLYVSQDCTVYKQDVIDLCTRHSPGSRLNSSSSNNSREPSSPEYSQTHAHNRSISEDHWRAVTILIPVRLGGETLNPVYIPCVQNMLAHPMCLGIIGGKPKHSVYFVGWQEEKTIFLDPHFCQDTVDMRQKDFPLQSYHCMSPRKMPFSKMDPSCTLGFYCKNRAEFEEFTVDAAKFASPPKEKGLYPLFVFVDGRSADISSAASPTQEERYLRVRHLDKKGRPRQPSRDSDDFVFL